MNDRGKAVLRFEVLGPLRVWRGGSALPLGPVQRRVVLAVLLLHANRPIGRERLIEAVWGEEMPTSAVNLVQRHVSGLRQSLQLHRAGAVNLTWTDAGYLLTVPPESLDLMAFEADLRRAREARSRGDPAVAAEALRAALARWRGPLCDGLASPLLDGERDRLAERYLDAGETRIELEIARGDPADSVAELRRLIAEHPLRERLRALLMTALFRTDRQADALEAYQAARRCLRDELGIEPGAPLQRLHQQILTADPELVRQGAAPVARPPARVAVAQLPHALGDFVGREAELDRLDLILRDEERRLGTAVVIAAIAGTAGVGKTSLAVTWAHRIRDRFPDGQLYVNLHGFDPAGSPTEPAKVIRGFLDAFAVPPDRIPAEVDEQAALYRSILAGRRVLIVLDNARDAAHVRPLLPGSPGCLVVVTSRDRLVSLVAVDGARAVVLDALSEADARRLLVRRLGTRRVDAEPAAVDEIIGHCARLPLALSVITARAATNPDFSLAAVAGELREARGSLDAFDGGDPATDVRAVFACSYDRLTAPAARLFRMLSLHAGPDISGRAAASLTATSAGAVRAALAELARANLISERVSGRYVLHDLLRAYARELTERIDSLPERHAAVARMLDHYLHSADYAGRLMHRYRDDPVVLPPPAAGVQPERPGDHRQALSWFGNEEPVLLTVLGQAPQEGHDRHAWQLAWAIAHHLYRRGHWHDATAASEAALAAARRLDDARGQAVSHGCIAYAAIRLDRYADADRHLREAFALYHRLGDHVGVAHVHRSKAWALDRQSRHREALPHVQEALRLFELGGHATGAARALNGIGWFHCQLGRPLEALIHCRRALDLQEDAGDRFGQGDTLDSLGRAYHELGRFDLAIDSYRRAIEVYQEFGDSYNEADTLVSLGQTQYAAGAAKEAISSWREAVRLFDRLSHPDAGLVEVRIANLTGAIADWAS